jgi:hypothetical protein
MRRKQKIKGAARCTWTNVSILATCLRTLIIPLVIISTSLLYLLAKGENNAQNRI